MSLTQPLAARGAASAAPRDSAAPAHARALPDGPGLQLGRCRGLLVSRGLRAPSRQAPSACLRLGLELAIRQLSRQLQA